MLIPLFLFLFISSSLLFHVVECSSSVYDTDSVKKYCRWGDVNCWPSQQEISDLQNSLTPSTSNRNLTWLGPPHPLPSAVPIYSGSDQPLYGLSPLDALYVQTEADRPNDNNTQTCFVNNFTPVFCLASTRNSPLNNWTPGFIVWALNSADVIAAVNFAVKHNLCISVLSTGHDFLNRHSCPDGMMIRTSLLKSSSFNSDASELTVGAGLVFSEIQNIAKQKGKYVASGWATTVGIVGWSLGGGHGPFGPSAGLGVDNIVAATVVSASGVELSLTSSNNNSDLLWALRGGGGSNWGVVTSLTIRTHTLPSTGITKLLAYWIGDLCATSGLPALTAFVDDYTEFITTADKRFSGLAFFTPTRDETNQQCKANYTVMLQYAFLGDKSDPAISSALSVLSRHVGPVYTSADVYASWFDEMQTQAIEYIVPVPTYAPSSSYVGGVASVLISNVTVKSGVLASSLIDRLSACLSESHCSRQELYHDLTGAPDSPRLDSSLVSIPSSFRKALLHWVTGAWNASAMRDKYYTLAENSYFGESAYQMDDTEAQWKDRYWGTNYDKLEQIKLKYDPDLAFTCHHCVGSDRTEIDQ